MSHFSFLISHFSTSSISWLFESTRRSELEPLIARVTTVNSCSELSKVISVDLPGKQGFEYWLNARSICEPQ